MNGVVFWAGNFVVDYVMFALSCGGMVGILLAFKVDVYTENSNLVVVSLIFAGYGWAMLPLDYLLHFFINSPATAVIIVALFSDFLGTSQTVLSSFDCFCQSYRIGIQIQFLASPPPLIFFSSIFLSFF